MNKNSNIFERLMQISDYYGFNSVNDFALNGLNYKSSEKLNRLKDETKKPSIDIISDISNKFENVDLNWLINDRGNMLLSETKSRKNVVKINDHNNDHIKDHKPNVKKMPPMETYNIGMVSDLEVEYQKVVRKIKFADGVSLVDEGAPFYPLPVSAGTVAELIQEDERPTGYVSIPGLSCKAYFPVIGFSFGDIIPAGSIIGVDFINSWETLDPDCVYFIVTADQRMAKRLVADPDDPNNLICLSPNYQSFKISKDEIKVIHKVIFVGRPI